jgi:hypothetical protein
MLTKANRCFENYKQMKKLILILLLFPIILACKKEEFEGERPDERLSKTLEEYNSLLSEAKYGWKAHLFPKGGRGFGFYFRFNGKNRVNMMGDVALQSGTTSKESSYRLKATVLPSLYFDTYSYIHLLSDPDPEAYSGTPGWGLYSDFEFSFIKVSPDTIRLKGNLLGSEMILVRATQEEQAAYEDGNLNTMRQQVTDYQEDQRFNFLESPKGNQISTALNVNTKILSLTFDSAGTLTTRQLGFAFSGLNELILSAPFHHEDLFFDKIIIDGIKNKLFASKGSKQFEFLSTGQPIFPLGKMMGTDYQAIVVPMEEEVPGSGSDFNARRNAFLTTARAALSPGTTFPQMALIFNPADETMTIQQIITQGTANFSAYYVFAFKKAGDDYQFKYEGPMYSNAEVLEQAYLPIIQGITSGNIILDYELSGSALRASGVSSGTPAFKFIGELQ